MKLLITLYFKKSYKKNNNKSANILNAYKEKLMEKEKFGLIKNYFYTKKQTRYLTNQLSAFVSVENGNIIYAQFHYNF